MDTALAGSSSSLLSSQSSLSLSPVVQIDLVAQDNKREVVRVAGTRLKETISVIIKASVLTFVHL